LRQQEILHIPEQRTAHRRGVHVGEHDQAEIVLREEPDKGGKPVDGPVVLDEGRVALVGLVDPPHSVLDRHGIRVERGREVHGEVTLPAFGEVRRGHHSGAGDR
jgi:hypothetical protein